MRALYQASPMKRRRATNAEMEQRAEFLLDYAEEHGPVTVRGLFYQAVAHGVPGIGKDELGYSKVQHHVLQLRREGRMPYSAIADASRYMRRPRTFDGVEECLTTTAHAYRKALWADSDVEVEVWIEKSALAGVIAPVTFEYDVPLMPTGGYTSETFAFEAVDDLRGTEKTLIAYALYDFDRSGQDAAASLREKVERFGDEFDVPVVFYQLGLTLHQVQAMNLPTRPAKRGTPADRRWPHAFAAELDAIPPDTLRDMVRRAIEVHLPQDELVLLKQVEAEERRQLLQLVGRAT